MKKKNIVKLLIVLFLGAGIISCGGGGGGDVAVAPTATMEYADIIPVGSAQDIIVFFDKSMDTSSLVVSGTAGNANVVWSATSQIDDTVTLTPADNLGHRTGNNFYY